MACSPSAALRVLCCLDSVSGGQRRGAREASTAGTYVPEPRRSHAREQVEARRAGRSPALAVSLYVRPTASHAGWGNRECTVAVHAALFRGYNK
jgi:hypothetical protein